MPNNILQYPYPFSLENNKSEELRNLSDEVFGAFPFDFIVESGPTNCICSFTQHDVAMGFVTLSSQLIEFQNVMPATAAQVFKSTSSPKWPGTASVALALSLN